MIVGLSLRPSKVREQVLEFTLFQSTPRYTEGLLSVPPSSLLNELAYLCFHLVRVKRPKGLWVGWLWGGRLVGLGGHPLELVQSWCSGLVRICNNHPLELLE